MGIKCPICHSDNPETATFCADCGTKLISLKDVDATKTIEIPIPELAPGSTFASRYQIVEELGKGGMGRVYKVNDTELKENVALKLLKKEIGSDEKTIERFRNELKIARRVSHKHVCRMHDIGRADETYFITMEFVEGEDLRSLIRKEGNLTDNRAISITKQVCEGLAEAHRLGVVHRDLKPQNIMIEKEGHAKIMDFGISHSLEAKGLTQTGMIIGTPNYMSPEQAAGEDTDQRSDIYSLGVILYEMVTGTVPFKGESALSIALKHKTEEPTNPREFNDQISEQLIAAILKCMEKDRESRYQSAEELLLELRNIEAGMPIVAALRKPQIPAFLVEGAKELEEIRPVFVAREQELEKLSRFLEISLSKKGRVAFVTGEAGSGKTALIQEFAHRAQEEYSDLIVAAGKCNAHTGIGDPYLPFREALGMLSGEVEDRWAAGSLSKDQATRLWNLLHLTVQAIVETGPDLIDTFISGAELVSRAKAYSSQRTNWVGKLEKLVERKTLLPPDAMLQQSNLFQQYSRVLLTAAREQPLLLVLDDLQWADAGSISLLFHLGQEVKGSKILLLGSYRPEDVAQGRGGERHPLEGVVNELQRDFGEFEVELSKAEGRSFLDAFLDTEPNKLGAKFRDTFFHQTRGHPLFTIEMLRSMQEQGMLIEDKKGCWVEGMELDWEALPAKIDAVIGERIGRLEVRLQELLTVASVEGGDFTSDVLAMVRKEEVREVIHLLSSELDKKHHLVSAKGIRRMDGQRLSIYTFQHILFQRYLYNSLDKVERSHLHEEVGTALESLYGEQSEEIAVQLTRHFQEAGLVAKAVEYLQKAGNKAVRLSANEEAISHYNKGLKVLKALPDSPERAHQELALLLGLRAPLTATRGYASSELGRVVTQSEELCKQIGESPQLFHAVVGLQAFYLARGETKKAYKLAKQLVSLSQSSQDSIQVMMANWFLGLTLLYLGEFSSARASLDQVVNSYDPQQHGFLAYFISQDAGASCLSWLGWALWFLGYPDQAMKRCKEALVLAKKLDHPFTLAFTHGIAGSLFLNLLREFQKVKEHNEVAFKLGKREGYGLFQAVEPLFRGMERSLEVNIEEGINLMWQGLNAYRSLGTGMQLHHYLGLLAELCERGGKIKEGLEAVAEGLEDVNKSGEGYYEAELYRIKGELALKKSGVQDKTKQDEAERCFRQAIDISRSQKAKSWELRAVMSLSRLLRKQDKKPEARQMLAEVYGWFTEGFDTPDLKEAKALLKELS
jgi:serine/threonine protein kinase/predicted ATPase